MCIYSKHKYNYSNRSELNQSIFRFKLFKKRVNDLETLSNKSLNLTFKI